MKRNYNQVRRAFVCRNLQATLLPVQRLKPIHSLLLLIIHRWTVGPAGTETGGAVP